MKLRDVVQNIRAEVLYGEELLDSIDIECAYGADLMSDVLAFARPGSLLLTGLTNIQIVRPISRSARESSTSRYAFIFISPSPRPLNTRQTGGGSACRVLQSFKYRQ